MAKLCRSRMGRAIAPALAGAALALAAALNARPPETLPPRKDAIDLRTAAPEPSGYF